VFEAAIQRAADRPGFFSMTVPTGGGKTLSAMAFALAHARAHNLRRVIVVIPFLSIIEQNAAIYRRVLGDDVVVENHSAVRVPDEDVHDSSSERAERMALELAAENWDSPVVVTTSVQFVESLLARQPSRCRKLHNIARSVVIFDECQALPGHLLNPTLSVLRELVRTWGVSILLCSATQPGFRQSPGLVEGLAAEEIREIAPSPPNLYLELRRVRYLLPARDERLSWAALAEAVSQRPQALVVVNTRKAAFDLWQEILQRLPNEEQASLFHLSSAMCAQHRFDFLGEACVPSASTIRGRLDARLSCRVVSTQLIEAGVDVDFPVLCRAMGPLDSLVQAAGRCNREGRLAELGEVHVFHPAETGMPRGPYCVASQVTATILDGLDPDRLATDPSLFADYFGRLYGGLLPTDHARRGERPIQDDRRDRNFRTVSEHAKAISDDMWPVVVPYGKAPELVADARARRRFGRNDLRRLQRFLVNVRNREYTQLQQMGVLHPLMDGVDLQVVDACCYNVNLGLVIRQRPLEDFVQ
jgi:CRISPR-associated endonuclease/helicase Cas3